MKTCSKCRQCKPRAAFHCNASRADGLAHYCRQCAAIRDAAKYDPERASKNNKAWRAANPGQSERAAKWVAANPERAAATSKRWRDANVEKLAAANKAWRGANKAAVCAIRAKRRAAELQRTPARADADAIRAIYIEASARGLTVDHVFPLQGKTVSGLHVHTNLQLLSGAVNRAKGNRHWPDMPEAT
ncbi:MAG: hypothetical protein ACREMY_17000 [bacterium]